MHGGERTDNGALDNFTCKLIKSSLQQTINALSNNSDKLNYCRLFIYFSSAIKIKAALNLIHKTPLRQGGTYLIISSAD